MVFICEYKGEHVFELGFHKYGIRLARYREVKGGGPYLYLNHRVFPFNVRYWFRHG